MQNFLALSFDADSINHLSIFQNFLSHEQVSLTYEDYLYAIRFVSKK